MTTVLTSPNYFRDNVLTLDAIVATINDGGTTGASAELIAGYYAFDAAAEGCDGRYGNIDKDTIEAHLDVLIEAGARFGLTDAIEAAMPYVQALQAGDPINWA